MRTAILILGTIVLLGLGRAGVNLIRAFGVDCWDNANRVDRVISVVFVLSCSAVLVLCVLSMIVAMWQGGEWP